MTSLLSYLIVMVPLSIIFNLPLLFIILKKQYLTVPFGILSAASLGISLFIIQPFFWVVLCIFFFSSSILTKMKAKEKSSITSDFAKGSTKRDAIQVTANGIIPFLFAFGYFLFELLPNLAKSHMNPHNPFDPFFIGVFAAFAVHTADTWATEIGILSKSPPRLVTNIRQKVDPGTSGGITFYGSCASLLGASLIAAVYLLFAIITSLLSIETIIFFFLIAIGGFLGSIIDSIEGAAIQGIYYCNDCKKETETNPHKRCGNETILHRGIQQINNDFVNLSSALIVTLFICLIILLL
ncbi:MAG: DUF92 domain-containing protein [Candidatus Heimdallarchaeota archaeon]|nr:MAG: DUF92 domain-containing protein [Candidatus Heimdallarchaeota archaeon]